MRIENSPARRWLPVLAAGSLVTLVVPLAGCGDSSLARTFGLTRDAPDEFAVTTQAPLSMPPDFNLRPPRPGVLRPQQRPEREQAEEALVPQLALTGSGTGGAVSRGQSALLDESGPAVRGDVRQQVDQDAKLEQANASFLDRVLTWRKTDTRNLEVDPEKENQRLRQNAALGQANTSGVTPTIAPKRESWFQKLFNWF
jgi:hypothetical protein